MFTKVFERYVNAHPEASSSDPGCSVASAAAFPVMQRQTTLQQEAGIWWGVCHSGTGALDPGTHTGATLVHRSQARGRMMHLLKQRALPRVAQHRLFHTESDETRERAPHLPAAAARRRCRRLCRSGWSNRCCGSRPAGRTPRHSGHPRSALPVVGPKEMTRL